MIRKKPDPKLTASQQGFSLIELIIVIAISGILATMAVSQYRSYVIQGCRSDAMIALEAVASAQAQYYWDHNGYASTIMLLPVYPYSTEGHYTLATQRIDDDPNTFLATAIQTPNGTCLPDHDVQYRISHTGYKQKKLNGADWIDNWK